MFYLLVLDFFIYTRICHSGFHRGMCPSSKYCWEETRAQLLSISYSGSQARRQTAVGCTGVKNCHVVTARPLASVTLVGLHYCYCAPSVRISQVAVSCCRGFTVYCDFKNTHEKAQHRQRKT